MKRSEDEVKKLLDGLAVPGPRPEARENALRVSLREFHRLQKEGHEKVKGLTRHERLTGRREKGGSAMRKLGYAAAGFALGGIALAITIPNFLNFRMKARSPVEQSSRGYGGGGTVTMGDAPRDKYTTFTAPPSPPPLMKDEAKSQKMPRANREVATTPLSQEYVGRDRFETFDANPVKVAAEEPVSTFSVDVDTASYAFVRRALHNGALPQKNAVRIEEMINYFDYDYPLPTEREEPFRATVAVSPTPWSSGTKLLHIGIKGLDIVPEKRPRANLVFLLDVSGSMGMPDKLPLLKTSLRMLVESLDSRDTVAIVVYAGAAGTVLEPTPVVQSHRILAALERLRAGGSTAGGEGIRQAYALAEANYDVEAVNRVILATDGDFNVGIRNHEELKGFVERKRESGIFLSVLGFGQGNLNDALMQKLAQNGNGNAAYIDTLNEARKVLVEEAGGTFFTIAGDVKIQVEFNPATVAEYRLIGYETRMLRREEFNNDRVDAGDIGSGHTVTAMYEITPRGSSARLVDDLRYERQGRDTEGITSSERDEYAFLKIRYKVPGEKKSRLIKDPVGPNVEYASVSEAPEETRFAAAVAAFGQILRGDPSTGDFSYDNVIELARSARGEDPFGYRAEFISLVRLAKTARTMGGR
jgi:Ca-activated chloride channel family protein